MPMTAKRASISDIAPLRERYRSQAECQIVRWSLLPRGLAYAVSVLEGNQMVGYGVVSTVEPEETVVECFADDPVDLMQVARLVLEYTGAPCWEAQTNMSDMMSVYSAMEGETHPGPLLFAAGEPTDWRVSEAIFRPRQPDDLIFTHRHEPVGPWVIEVDGTVAATGGYLTHYNPPYADLYMEVHPDFRRKGYGSYLLQEIQKVCRGQNLVPAARCAPENEASARCTEKSGMPRCGQLLVKRLAR